MTITLSIEWIPAILTALIIFMGAVWRLPPRRGDYDFGPEIQGIFLGVVALIAILLVWLFYFALRAWGVV